jgi:hypothetical protein
MVRLAVIVQIMRAETGAIPCNPTVWPYRTANGMERRGIP